MPNIFAGFISCLEAVTFFRVSKLTYCRPKEPVQFGPRSKPCKRQTAPAAGGTDGNRSRAGDTSLNGLTEAPVVFSAFAMGETASPERSVRRMQRGQDIPHVKSLRKQGAEV